MLIRVAGSDERSAHFGTPRSPLARAEVVESPRRRSPALSEPLRSLNFANSPGRPSITSAFCVAQALD